MTATEKHPWVPYIPDNAKVLILGTFPPKPDRWSMEFYYPNRINDFWRIIGLIFHGNINHFWDDSIKSFRLNDIKKFLDRYNIAMYDTASEIRRLKNNASDKFLEIVKPIALSEILNTMPNCHAIATTGEKAAQVIASLTSTPLPKMGERITTQYPNQNRELHIYRMPSTSRAYPMSIYKKAEYYSKMFISTGILK